MRSARAVHVTLRVPHAAMDALEARATAQGIPLRTYLQRALIDAGNAPDPREILREVQKLGLLTQRLWLATAQSTEAREAILRIVQSVEAITHESSAAETA